MCTKRGIIKEGEVCKVKFRVKMKRNALEVMVDLDEISFSSQSLLHIHKHTADCIATQRNEED